MDKYFYVLLTVVATEELKGNTPWTLDKVVVKLDRDQISFENELKFWNEPDIRAKLTNLTLGRFSTWDRVVAVEEVTAFIDATLPDSV